MVDFSGATFGRKTNFGFHVPNFKIFTVEPKLQRIQQTMGSNVDLEDPTDLLQNVGGKE